MASALLGAALAVAFSDTVNKDSGLEQGAMRWPGLCVLAVKQTARSSDVKEVSSTRCEIEGGLLADLDVAELLGMLLEDADVVDEAQSGCSRQLRAEASRHCDA